MQEQRDLIFGSFRLDLRDERLWRGQEVIHLRHKALAVLRCLVTQPGQLVTKDTLFAQVWPETTVSESALVVAIRELRQGLGDQARTPRYIETVHRRGYRFICALEGHHSEHEEKPVIASSQTLPLNPERPELALRLVGRNEELAQLRTHWGRACQSERQVVVITGEAGIGKTSLVDAFVAQMESTADILISRGQCIEQYGAGEPYLPLLEALGRLGRGARGARLVEILRQQAPSWLAHLPMLVAPEEAAALPLRLGSATRARMLRELAEAIETLTAESPLILVLEDLHWSDVSTIEWLAYVARRRDPARLLVLGTYRLVEAIVHNHPVRTVMQELQQQGQGDQLALRYLTEANVAAYLTQRFGDLSVTQHLARLLYQRTNGNPLFLVALVDDLARRGQLQDQITHWTPSWETQLGTIEVPESLHHLIERQFEQLDPEDQNLLVAASVAGVEFTATVLAAALDDTVEAIEIRCDALARQGLFLDSRGTEVWPDGTLMARYGFLHALYQEVLYKWVSMSRRIRWHRQIGLELERGYGSQTRQIATELAAHFVHGRDTLKAVMYLRYAGVNAMHRHAQQEAIEHFVKGLEILETLPDSPECRKHELALQLTLGTSLTLIKSAAAPEVETAYTRALELCEQSGDTSRLLEVTLGLQACYLARGALQAARELGEQCLGLAQDQEVSANVMMTHHALGAALLAQGEFVQAQEHLDHAITLYSPEYHHRPIYQTSSISCRTYGSFTLWIRGYVDLALERSQAAITLAQNLSDLYSIAVALFVTAWLHLQRGEWHTAQERVEASITLAEEYGCALLSSMGRMLRGRLQIELGGAGAGLVAISQAHTDYRATDSLLCHTTFLIWLAEAQGKAGQLSEGLDTLAQVFTSAKKTGERWYKAEICRIQGEFLLRETRQSQLPASEARAETCFSQALDIARRQQSRSWELRAATSLARLFQKQNRRDEARELLSPIYGWFTEGLDTSDLQAAKQLLDELS